MTARRIFNRHRSRRRRTVLATLAAGLVAVLAIAGAGTGFAADRVTARAGLHDTYARMAFDLPEGLGHRVKIDGTKLTVTFDRRVATDLSALRRIMGERVERIALEESRIEATLAQPWRVRDFMTGRTLVVDLMSAGAAVPGDTRRIGVRVGEHPTYTRVVFDWPSTVDYRVDNDGAVARIRFRRPARIDVPEGAIAGAPRVSALDVSPPAEGDTTVALTFDGRIRHFRDGFKVVVDVLDLPKRGADRASASQAEPEPKPQAAAAPTPESKTASTGEPPAANVPSADGSEPAETAGTETPQTQAHGADAPRAEVANDAGVPAPDAAAEGTGHDLTEAGALHATSTATAERGPTQLLPASMQGMADPAMPARPAETAKAPASLPDDVADLAIEMKTDLDGALIRLPFNVETGAAVFRRGGHLWLVFDRVYRVDTAEITAAAQEFVKEAEQLPHGRALVLRLETVPGYNALVAREGNRWEVVLVPQLLKPAVAMEVETHLGSVPTVSVGPSVPGGVFRIRDPAVGDDIRVGTLRGVGDGVAQWHRFADFHLLPSVQGVAVVPLSDRVDLRAGQDRMIVSAVGGLRLTDAEARARVLASSDRGDGFARFFDFSSWRHEELGDFDHGERELLGRIRRAEDADRDANRLELARFYLSHGLADRTLGILEVVADGDPDITRVPTFKALRGAARYVIGDIAGAEKDLFDREFDGEPEILLWRAAVRGVDGDFINGAIGLQQSEEYVQAYPDALRKRFAFLGAEMSLDRNDPVGAEFWLEVIRDAPLTPSDRDRIRVYRAGIAAQNGEIDSAIQLYDATIEGRDRLSRALATMEKAELLLREEVITPAEAVDMLDRLRYVWRGDDLEFRILRRLGELEIAAGRYREGFGTLKRAAANFPENPGTPAIADKMRAAFSKLYLEGEADELPPVTAIALFEEFRELAPAGEQGDAMIRRLADRMVEVDLLDKAAGLLDHLVEYRLEGRTKGEVGARLAMIHVLNRQPDAALAALDKTDVNGLPLEVADARSLVASRAEVLRGDFPRALRMVSGMDGTDADSLRAEIYWRQQDWPRAARLYGRLAGPAPADGATLPDDKARYVLNRAVALALAGDNLDLATLNRGYGESMAGTSYAADFQAITGVGGAARDLTDVLARVAVVDDFKAFMESYRARINGAKTTAGS